MLLLFYCYFVHVSSGSSYNKRVEYINGELRDKLKLSFSDEEKDLIRKKTESHEYKAETTRLLTILIESLYHNKDIFMRELISNANDALDKIRFAGLKDPTIYNKGPKSLQILIDVNEEEKIISITDTGIGMTKDEMIENLGRIAKSGTFEFQKMLQSGDTNLIGQFGVGFYSSFLVADKVTVISKSDNDTKQWIWESNAVSSFTVSEDPRGVTLERGTSVILHLKDSCYNYLDRDRIINIIRHYSMFVDFPVKIWHFKEELIEDVSANEKVSDEDFGIDIVHEIPDEEEEAKKKEDVQMKMRTVWQWIHVNDRKPIWLRDPQKVFDTDYNEFFTLYFKEPVGPLTTVHFQAEGSVQFSALFFVPTIPPPSDQLFMHDTRNIRLYVKRILVSDEWTDELLPDYLHFMKGIIDSNDLTLNVDRDRLVKMRALPSIKRRVTSKILSVIRKMYIDDPDRYDDFYAKYGGNMKYGIVDDPQNKDMLSRLLMFYSSYSPKRLTTLTEYKDRMKRNQEKIYWVGAETLEEAIDSPYTESLLNMGYEVLFAIEPIDVHCFERMEDFIGIPLENPEKVTKAPEEKIQDIRPFNVSFKQKFFNKFVRWYIRVVGEKLETVILSDRLVTTPAICTATSIGYTASHERLMKAQTIQDSKISENLFMNKKVLELNYKHPIVINLIERARINGSSPEVKEEARLLFEIALLAGGYSISDSLNFTKRVYHMIGKSYDIADKVNAFEDDKRVFYPKVEDDFEFEHKGKPVVKLLQDVTIDYGSKPTDDDDETPADLHPSTPKDIVDSVL